MAEELNMPQMGYDMQEGTLVRWLKSEGAEITTGEAIAEIETDKAVVEFESTSSGVLLKILVQEGSTVPVGKIVAIVGEAGEELPEYATTSTDEKPEGTVSTEGVSADDQVRSIQPSPTQPTVSKHGIKSSPVARHLAADKGIDLALVIGTGPGGRITRDDVLKHTEMSLSQVENSPNSETESVATSSGVRENVPLSRMRQQIARITTKSKQEIPHFYVSTEIDMTDSMKMRSQLNNGIDEKSTRISVNDLIIKACVDALKKYPKLNASFIDDSIQVIEQINIGIAISEDEGLIVPAIMDCASKTLAGISSASKDLIDRSKNGTLSPQEYTDGTFTISNLGMFDVTNFAAIIHPPQAAVIAVGTITERPIVISGNVSTSQMMNATLSADHRVVDGAEGAQFLVEIKRILESPVSLLA